MRVIEFLQKVLEEHKDELRKTMPVYVHPVTGKDLDRLFPGKRVSIYSSRDTARDEYKFYSTTHVMEYLDDPSVLDYYLKTDPSFSLPTMDFLHENSSTTDVSVFLEIIDDVGRHVLLNNRSMTKIYYLIHAVILTVCRKLGIEWLEYRRYFFNILIEAVRNQQIIRTWRDLNSLSGVYPSLSGVRFVEGKIVLYGIFKEEVLFTGVITEQQLTGLLNLLLYLFDALIRNDEEIKIPEVLIPLF